MITTNAELRIEYAHCTCEIGLHGSCGHIAGLLYQVSQYKSLGHKLIPEDVAQTSQPQTWHIPRGKKITPTVVQNLEVRGYSSNNDHPQEDQPIVSTLYNPVRFWPQNLAVHADELEESCPDLPIIDVLRETSKPQTMVQTKFGLFPKGSPLSYQQRLDPGHRVNMPEGPDFPAFPMRDVMKNDVHSVLNETECNKLESLRLSKLQIQHFEKTTRQQSESKLWHKLRATRITASSVGEIYKRQKSDLSKFIQRLMSTNKIQTSAMKRGLELEPFAAVQYSKLHGDMVNLYPCGIVISESSPWLAASPDRGVYLPTRTPSFGLLEIKCPQAINLQSVDYLRLDDQGQLQLKKRHNYYYQILTQLAVTGMSWCDLFVWCEAASTSHCETIWFNPDEWQQVKDKIDLFFFDNLLTHI